MRDVIAAAAVEAGNRVKAGPSLPTDEGLRKIPADALLADPELLWPLLGSWPNSLDSLGHCFRNASPFPHVVIDNFFSESYARELVAAFPSYQDEMWHVYDNPLEQKRACSDPARMPAALRQALLALCAPAIVELVRVISGLSPSEELQADEYCHGGGLHCHGMGEKLDLHVDYSRHPISGLERRFNLIIYLNPCWRDSYGGALELWSCQSDRDGDDSREAPQPKACGARLSPLFNRAVLFSTTGPSIHGFPEPISCPADESRRSLALYYLTPARPCSPAHSKARYVACPGKPDNPALKLLRQVRSKRRIEAADLEAYHSFCGSLVTT
mmetsp:Transcript_24595/g.40791  ORF Transcript_24595/g.40791 Transcript_24595/m.40791 type:complete len:328 (-) Transcript_24595:238-1221(-)